MKNVMKISEIFASDASRIVSARKEAVDIHKTDIRAAGNQVEITVREYFKRILPKKYYSGHGHLIDQNGVTSNQLDIIISDNENLPSLLKAEDGTEYFPYDSVYAIGEIKSSYRSSEKPIEKFSKTLKKIKNSLEREEIPNTTFHGLQNDTLIRDTILGKRNRILNKLFSFIIFVDGEEFSSKTVKKELEKRKNKYLPNVMVFLNKGILVFADFDSETQGITRYPDENALANGHWTLIPLTGANEGTPEGNHLAYLYYCLVEHLTNSFLEPASLKGYLENLLVGKKSTSTPIT